MTFPSDQSSGFEFEGAEKKLEIDFRFSDQTANKNGLRIISQEKWAEMLQIIKCSIISRMQNDYLDAYVLSESSLFIYPTKFILKTCGTTRTLLCLDYLREIWKSCSLEVDFVFFSRKNLKNPQCQYYPHNNFDEEIDYLNKYFDGKSYIIGPTRGDHWNLYIYDRADIVNFNPNFIKDQTLEMMMTQLDTNTMKNYYKDQSKPITSDKEVTKKTGIAQIFPEAITDEFMFDPCGYSVNGIFDQFYYTIHITPEPQCSYVSFETNSPLDSFQDIVNKVLTIFKPGNVQVVAFEDKGLEAGPPKNMRLQSFTDRELKMRSKCNYDFENYQVSVIHCTKN